MGDDGILSIEFTGKVMMISVILLLLILLLVIALHFYVRWFWRRVELESSSAAAEAEITPRSLRGSDACRVEPGLDPKFLRSLPVVVFSGDESTDGLECAVCLCEVVDGEKARVLPRCRHGFHVECIDMWLQSHVSCPLCRKSVVEEELLRKDAFIDVDGRDGGGSAGEDGGRGQNMDLSPNFPTNVLFWGNETQVSSRNNNGCLEGGNSSCPLSSSGLSASSVSRYIGLVIDIPAQAGENPGLGSGSGSGSETKSPVQARLGSLRRLLSRDRRVASSSRGSESQRSGDFENEMVSRGLPY